MSKHSHNDDPVDIDGFVQEKFIEEMAKIIEYCTPPKGIAINGYWGCGKTSALLQIRKALRDNKNIVPVWFEAWRYQNDGLPIVALLQEIRTQISGLGKAVNSTGKLSRIAFDSVFDMVGKAAGIPALDKITGAAQRFETQNREAPLASQELRELLETAISQVLGKDKGKDKRLVIFIDDLDRCMPKTALQLLEGIKVYLNLNNCVLVFAMDQRQIEQALQEANIKHPHEYLEKICQDIHHLPLPSQAAKSKYLLDLLDKLDCHQHNAALNEVLTRYDCLPANPRKIKALSNRLALMLRADGCINYLETTLALNASNSSARTVVIPLNSEAVEAKTKRYSLLLAMACIHTFHRLINEQLEKNPRYINDVINYAKNPEEGNPLYGPMAELLPSIKGDQALPVNPSDSNVFRLHGLFGTLHSITEDEIKPFLTSTHESTNNPAPSA
jgi:hypothetical protein